MIPVLGILICGYFIVRMVEIVTAKERPPGFLVMLALLMITACLAAALYFAAAGGVMDAMQPGRSSPLITDTTFVP